MEVSIRNLQTWPRRLEALGFDETESLDLLRVFQPSRDPLENGDLRVQVDRLFAEAVLQKHGFPSLERFLNDLEP